MKRNIILFLLLGIVCIFSGCGKTKEELVYTLIYELNYEIDGQAQTIKETINDFTNYEAPNPSREGYDFLGWYVDQDCTEKMDIEELHSIEITSSCTEFFYAKWKRKSYVVRFYCGDELISRQEVFFNDAANAPKAKLKSGYSFIGWDKDYTNVKEDLEINAKYEFNNTTNNVIVILGNWMNDDGTISSTMRKRLELALTCIDEFNPCFIVVTGGMANSKAGISEAQAMYNYLVEHNINENLIIKEDASMSTYQNAVNTIKKLEDIEFSNLIIVSTIEHFVNYTTIKYFDDAIMANSKTKSKNIKIMMYTNSGSY